MRCRKKSTELNELLAEEGKGTLFCCFGWVFFKLFDWYFKVLYPHRRVKCCGFARLLFILFSVFSYIF